MCIRGYSEIQTTLNEVRSGDVVAYFVWLPILKNDSRNDAIQRAAEFQDPRVLHYWDEQGLTGLAWQKRLGLESIAWDVYFIFDRSVMWQKEVPQPTYWMHQLRGIDKAPFLSEKEFQTELKKMLEMKQ